MSLPSESVMVAVAAMSLVRAPGLLRETTTSKKVPPSGEMKFTLLICSTRPSWTFIRLGMDTWVFWPT